MKKTTLHEVIIAAAALLPFGYLAWVWNTLPQQVAVHFDINGNPDRYSGKTELIFILSLVCLLPWALVKFLPNIDPRNKLQENPGALRNIRLVVTLFTSAIGCVVVQAALDGGKSIEVLLPILVGGFFAALGNYLINIKPNYFIGIRTPWTLENETVWRKTHRIGGKLMFWAGCAVVVAAVLFPTKIAMWCMISIPIVASLIPVVLSYKYYQEK